MIRRSTIRRCWRCCPRMPSTSAPWVRPARMRGDWSGLRRRAWSEAATVAHPRTGGPVHWRAHARGDRPVGAGADDAAVAWRASHEVRRRAFVRGAGLRAGAQRATAGWHAAQGARAGCSRSLRRLGAGESTSVVVAQLDADDMPEDDRGAARRGGAGGRGSRRCGSATTGRVNLYARRAMDC